MPYQHLQQMICDHAIKPVGKDKCFDHNLKTSAQHLQCGDKLTVYIRLENQVIKDIGFSGHSCDICTASASIMCKEMLGKHIEFAAQTYDSLQNGLYLDTAEIDPAIAPLMVVGHFPSRVDCALLPWNMLDRLIYITEAA